MAKPPPPPKETTEKPARKAGRPTSAKPRPPRRPKEQPQTPPQAPPPADEPQAAFAGAEQAALIETLSLNLAKAAMMAQGAMAEAALSQAARNADGPATLTPDPFNVGPAMTSVMTSLAARPEKLFQAQADLFGRYMDLWSSTARQAAGETPDPAPADKRFKDPAWSENPMFDMMRRSYLLTSDWMNGLVAGVEDVDPAVKRRAQFFTRLLTDAFSPSNFLASNPVALKALAETSGESLVKGMQNFAADLERGGGSLRISQADYGKFVVGENVATAPGQVVWRDELFELIQYAPAGETQHDVPLLIFPPWINKFYIMDLQPANSLIRWLSAQGFTVFVCSWVNPDRDKADFGFDDYLEKGVYRAVEKTLEQAGADRLNAVGYCIGGTLLGAGLAHMAAKGDTRVAAATFFAAQHDFAEAGDLLLFTDEHWIAEIERQMDAAGRRPARRGDGRNVQRASIQRPDLVLLHQQLSAGQGSAGLRPVVLERRSDANAKGAAPGLSAPDVRRQRPGQRRVRDRRPGRRPVEGEDPAVFPGQPRGPYRADELGLSLGAAVRRAGRDLHPGRIGPYRRRHQRSGGAEISALDQPRPARHPGGMAGGRDGASGQLVGPLGGVAARAVRQADSRS